jgi:ribosomal protein L37AE/L43A
MGVVTNCLSCGGPLRLDRERGILVCDHCGAQQELPATLDYVDLERETASRCPLCSRPLSTSRLDGYPLLCCARCFGMLIAMDCFAAVIDTVRIRENWFVQTVLMISVDDGYRSRRRLTSASAERRPRSSQRPPWDARRRLRGWRRRLRPCGYELAWRTIVQGQG